MSYKIRWEDANIIVHLFAVVELDEILEIDNLIYGDPRFDKMQFQLFDYSEAVEVRLDDAELEVIGALDNTSSYWNNHLKVAIVSDNPKVLAMADYYKSLVKDTHWAVKIFSHFQDAYEWCTIPCE